MFFALVATLLADVLRGDSWGITLNRIGLLFQLMAGVSVLPEIIGEGRLLRWEQAVLEVDLKLKGFAENLMNRLLDGESSLADLNRMEVLFVFAGWVIQYALGIGSLAATLSVSGSLTMSEPLMVLAILTVCLLFLYPVPLSMISAPYVWLRFSKEKCLSSLIVTIGDMCILWALPLSGHISLVLVLAAQVVVHMAVAWSGEGFSLERLLARVTFPLLLAGTVLELISTYLA